MSFIFSPLHIFFCCLKGEGGEILASGSLNMLVSPQSYEYKHTPYLNTVIFPSSAVSISIKRPNNLHLLLLRSPHTLTLLPTAVCPLIHSTIYVLRSSTPGALLQAGMANTAMPSPPDSLSRVSFILGGRGCLFSLPLAPSCKSSIPGCRQRKP